MGWRKVGFFCIKYRTMEEDLVKIIWNMTQYFSSPEPGPRILLQLISNMRPQIIVLLNKICIILGQPSLNLVWFEVEVQLQDQVQVLVSKFLIVQIYGGLLGS